jgi:hypothetical protein
LELLEGLPQPVFSFHVHPGHDSNISRNIVPAETTRGLVPRFPFRDMLRNGADEFHCGKYLEILPASLAPSLVFFDL